MLAFWDKFFSFTCNGEYTSSGIITSITLQTRIQWPLEFRKPNHSKTRLKFLNEINACESCNLVPQVLFLTAHAWRNDLSLRDRWFRERRQFSVWNRAIWGKFLNSFAPDCNLVFEIFVLISLVENGWGRLHSACFRKRQADLGRRFYHILFHTKILLGGENRW